VAGGGGGGGAVEITDEWRRQIAH